MNHLLDPNEDFSRTVYTVDSATATVQEHTLVDLCEAHAEKVTTPYGVRNRLFLDGLQLRAWREVPRSGSFLICNFDDEVTANRARLLCLRDHLFTANRNLPEVFDTQREAEAELGKIGFNLGL